MNRGPLSADELDDAAFRARLAPLADVVLPKAHARFHVAASGNEVRRRSRWPAMALAGLAVAAGLSFGLWTYLPRPVPAPVLRVHADQPAPPASAVSAPALPIPAPPAARPPPDKLLPVLLQRGNAALAGGDITAARLLFERAASAGSAEAALALGNTYDIRFLLETGAVGSAANQDLAAKWYRRAADLGDHRGSELLMRVEGGGQR